MKIARRKLYNKSQFWIEIWLFCQVLSFFNISISRSVKTGYSLRARQSQADLTGFSLCTRNSVNYSEMMLSDEEERDDETTRKLNKI